MRRSHIFGHKRHKKHGLLGTLVGAPIKLTIGAVAIAPHAGGILGGGLLLGGMKALGGKKKKGWRR